jgi:hypothetical protein
MVCVSVATLGSLRAAPAVLKPGAFEHHIQFFNTMENENVANLVPNAEAWAWLQAQVPLFESSQPEVEQVYWYRWWALRKHLRKTPEGYSVFTEFLTRPRPVSSALGHHLMEMRWFRDQAHVNSYVEYWLRGNNGEPQAHLRRYSSWLQDALWQRWLVTRDTETLLGLFDDLVADYEAWEKKNGLPSGLYWQHDVWDAMEESISGSRTKKNIRPTINSYMFGNARALAQIARLAGKPGIAARFDAKAAELRKLTLESLWDDEAKFFKVRLEDGPLADVREAIGFIPWYFGLPEKNAGYEIAWRQLGDTDGFNAPIGITTAERRHPRFRSHGVGTCEWDGAIWPYATTQTLVALANVLRDYPQSEPAAVTKRDYFDAFIDYTRSHRYNYDGYTYDGRLYLGEYQDEITGAWLKGRDERSRYYNHSGYADLLITGIVGLRPRADDTIEVHPLLPEHSWAWFCLDNVRYQGRDVTIVWDRDGKRYGRGKGLFILVDGQEIARGETLAPLTAQLPPRS